MPCITGNDANEVKIAAQGGIEALLKAMKDHPTGLFKADAVNEEDPERDRAGGGGERVQRAHSLRVQQWMFRMFRPAETRLRTTRLGAGGEKAINQQKIIGNYRTFIGNYRKL